MQDNSLYDVLGVSSDATQEQIRRAFLSLAHQFHPDLSSGPANEERFKQLRYAYEILSNVERRTTYDLSHDSYAAAIRQTPVPTAQDKSKPSPQRTSPSTFSFQTQWLKDRTLTRERWLFVGLAFATVGLIVVGSNYFAGLQTSFEQPVNSAQSQVATVELEIPRNEMPIAAPDFRKHFDADKPSVDENIDSSSDDETDDSHDPIARLQRNKKKKAIEDEWTFLPEAVFSAHIPLDSTDPLPLDIELPPVPDYRHYRLDPEQDLSALQFGDFPIASVTPARIELRADFWDGSQRFRNSPAPHFRNRMPSQEELTESMRINPAALPPADFDSFPTTGFAWGGIPATNHSQTNRLPNSSPGFKPPTIPRFVPPQVPRFSPPSIPNSLSGNL
jgi:curved DNA-binding protein CbpA